MNHREAEELLPWFAAGTLAAKDTEAVEAHLADCESCTEELGQLGYLREAVAEQGAEEPAYNPGILTAALKQIDAMEARAGEITVGESQTPPESRLKMLFQDLVERLQWRMTPPLARIAIGAQFALVLGLVVALTTAGTSKEDARGPEYGTVSKAQPGDYKVGFAPGVSEEQMRALLLEVNASIVAGPSASGFYTIDIDDGVDEAAAAETIRASGLSAILQPVMNQ